MATGQVGGKTGQAVGRGPMSPRAGSLPPSQPRPQPGLGLFCELGQSSSLHKCAEYREHTSTLKNAHGTPMCRHPSRPGPALREQSAPHCPLEPSVTLGTWHTCAVLHGGWGPHGL